MLEYRLVPPSTRRVRRKIHGSRSWSILADWIVGATAAGVGLISRETPKLSPRIKSSTVMQRLMEKCGRSVEATVMKRISFEGCGTSTYRGERSTASGVLAIGQGELTT